MTIDLTPAPLFDDVKPGPDDGAAMWVTTTDGLRLRVAAWGRAQTGGTVLLFPGRTEYVEKYAPAAADLAARGFATLSIDWRGQGLADRMLDDRRIGHVDQFTDYQKDVAAMLRAARALDMPEPYYMIAHSMGGCIGLRALFEGLPVKAAVFTAPMWGIQLTAPMRGLAWALSHLMPALGQGGAMPLFTKPEPYVLDEPYAGNKLTTDLGMHKMMKDQVTAHPDLGLGGPSYTWLREALVECLRLSRMPAPSVPALSFVGTNEQIVHVDRIADRMQDWPDGRLEQIQSAEHEVLMETPEVRAHIFDAVAAHFGSKAA